jgi:signal transduction histidine kinase
VANAPSVTIRDRADVLQRDEPSWWWAIAGVGIALSLAYVLVPERYVVLREFGFYNVVTVGAWIAILVGVRRYRPTVPRAWTLIAGGLFAWSIGDIAWSMYDAFGKEVPYPSVADGFYVVGYPLFAAGLATAVRARRVEREWRIALDALALTVAALLLDWVYIVHPVIDGDESWASKLFSVLYPTGDLILTGFAALLFLGSSWRATSMQLLLLGLVGTLGADIAYYAVSSGHGQQVVDSVYLVSLTGFALAALHPSMRALTDPGEESTELDNRKRLTLLGCVLAVPTAVVGIQHLRGEPLYLSAALGCAFALILIVLLRFDRMLTDARRTAAAAVALSRFSARLLALEPSDVDLVELARTQVESQRAAARQKHIALRCETAEGLPEITGDATRLTQMLDNLLTNAIKFTPEGGRVTTTVTGDDDRLRIAVGDTGVGIPADEVPRIFERFFRASTSSAISGTGLGLSIVQTIAEAHGGTVSIESEVGTGTTFFRRSAGPRDGHHSGHAVRQREGATTT